MSMATKTFRCPSWMAAAVAGAARDANIYDGDLIRKAVYAYLLERGYDPKSFVFPANPDHR